MKFLLAAVNAKYIHSNPAVYSLRAYAGEANRQYIELAEYTINNRTEEILADLYKRKPDVIGFSCYIWNFNLIQDLLTELPKILPETDIWLGGPEVSFNGKELLRAYPIVKGIMTGEGEATFKELLEYYVTVKNLKETAETKALQKNHVPEELANIKGLILRNTPIQERELTDMNDLPFLYEELEEFQNKIIYYESARGCPFRCSYCLSSIDKSVRLRSMDIVKKELQFFLDRLVPQVKLIDRTFNCNHAHAIEIWNYIKENDNGITNFHFEIAADIMTEEELLVLSDMRPGLVQLEIGVQSANEMTLREINRFVNTAHIARVVERLRNNENIHIHLDLIAGLPFEDYNSFAQSFNEVYAMQPQQLQLGFLKVLKGSPMAEKAKQYGIVYQSKPPYEVLYSNWLTYGEILKLKRIEEMVEIFYNSNQFTHILPVLAENFKHPFAMFEALADYYEEKGYFVHTPARVYRYQVLLAFACHIDSGRENLYRELLTFDYYLRENAKSRPEYASDLSAYREPIWNFYQREEENPVYLPEYKGYHAKQMMHLTHVEVFFYPVWKELPGHIIKKLEQPCFILFDYRERNPLTQDARIVLLTRGEEMK